MNYTKKGLNDPDNHDGVDRRGKVEAVTELTSLDSKTTVDGDCSH